MDTEVGGNKCVLVIWECLKKSGQSDFWMGEKVRSSIGSYGECLKEMEAVNFPET